MKLAELTDVKLVAALAALMAAKLAEIGAAHWGLKRADGMAALTAVPSDAPRVESRAEKLADWSAKLMVEKMVDLWAAQMAEC